MKKFVLIILWLAVVQTVHAQKWPDDGTRKVRITDPDHTIVAELDPDAHPSLETDRSYFWYGGNMIHSTQGGYSGKLLDGNYQEFYPSKGLKEQGKFKKGLKQGLWKAWDEAGTLTQTITWKRGKKQGDFQYYNAQGTLKQSGNYQDDVMQGKVYNYIGPDSVQVVKYKDGNVAKPAPVTEPHWWDKIKKIKFKKKPAAGAKK
jgi:hypothetical protein